VLLVPGWFDTARDLAALRIRLLAAGWPSDRVETITFDDPTGSNRVHAEELGRAVDVLLAATGADQVDIVAHSMGGLAARWYLRGSPDAKVRRVVFIASPHRGTLSAHLAWGGGRDEMMPESAFLDTLNAAPAVPDGVRALTIRTPVDTHIVPGESATLPGVPDTIVCCPTHAGLLRDDEVFEIVLDFLETPS
jgi:triacylglycerol lipase